MFAERRGSSSMIVMRMGYAKRLNVVGSMHSGLLMYVKKED